MPRMIEAVYRVKRAITPKVALYEQIPIKNVQRVVQVSISLYSDGYKGSINLLLFQISYLHLHMMISLIIPIELKLTFNLD